VVLSKYHALRHAQVMARADLCVIVLMFRLEQSFSADGGKDWEPNWIVSFTREKQ